MACNGGVPIKCVAWDLQRRYRWHWATLSADGAAEPSVPELKQGRNTIAILKREDGARLDKILLVKLEGEGRVDPGEL